MIRVSSSRIKDILAEADGLVLGDVTYTLHSGPKGIAATLKTNADDNDAAMATLKKYLKEKFPALIIYFEPEGA
ncbi:MAG: hypothetical protein FWB80_01825 [Defluviitaleaceae bacterium]|nr:hypothetical protein [Defluviitaleaceae bacterium]